MNIRYTPAVLLSHYVLKLLRVNDLIAEQGPDNYGGMNPIVPLAEEPKMQQYNQPYLVYGYTLEPYNDFPECMHGAITFVVRSTNYGEVDRILTTIKTAMERLDESAKDINHYCSQIADFVGIRFGHTALNYYGHEPAVTEGGRHSGIITIYFQYFVDYDVTTSFDAS